MQNSAGMTLAGAAQVKNGKNATILIFQPSSMNEKYSVVIVGGGIVGLAIAYELSSNGQKNICVIEKNRTIPGLNQSSTNGGIIHSGLYYPQDIEPLKAKLCVEGNALLYAFCEKYGLPHKKTGKLVLATSPAEEEYLEFFYQIGIENGIVVEKITGQEAKQLEPNLGAVTMALSIPSGGSAALTPLLEKLKELAENNGVTFLLGTSVKAIHPDNMTFRVETQTDGGTQIIETEMLINAAGLYADVLAKMVNPDSEYEIAPARGELARYRPASRKDIELHGRHLYPAPFCYYNDSKEIAALPMGELKKLLREGKVTKTLGAHVSPAYEYVNGEYVMGNIVTVGPIKSHFGGKDDYTTNLKNPEDYIQKVHSYFPKLKAEDLEPHYAGIMAVLKGFTDFVIQRDDKFPNCINLVGMDSPAWTASLAIAKHVRAQLA